MEITLRDVYERVTELVTQFAKFGGHLENVNARLEAGQAKMADHETRLRVVESKPPVPDSLEARVSALEKLAWKLVGGFAAVNALAVLVEWLLWSKP
jgi:hypothetical protein